MEKSNIKKIMVFGLPGSGKSTFALKLSKELNIPTYHLDKFFFASNWQERNHDEFLKDLNEIVNKDSWIIDGNSIKSLDIRFAKADVVIYFSMPRLLCLYRLLKRLIVKDNAIDDRAENCREAINLKLIKYMWNFDDKVKLMVDSLKEQFPKVKFYQVSNDYQLKYLLNDLI